MLRIVIISALLLAAACQDQQKSKNDWLQNAPDVAKNASATTAASQEDQDMNNVGASGHHSHSGHR